MKKLLASLFLLTSSLAFAGEPVKEMYVSIEPTVQLIISAAPCKLWKAPDGVQLNYAYAQNMETGETVHGCFTHSGDIIQIELVDDITKEIYSYKVKADFFLPRPTL